MYLLFFYITVNNNYTRFVAVLLLDFRSDILLKMLSFMRCGSYSNVGLSAVLKQSTNGGFSLESIRLFATRSYRSAGQAVRRKTLKEVLTQPATETPFFAGKLAVAGGAALSIGALCYYGLGLSSESGILEQSMLWPEYVRNRVHSTYQYLGGSLLLTTASAMAVARTPFIMNILTRNSVLGMFGTMAALIGTGAVCQSITYDRAKLDAKHIAWALHCGTLGAVIAPLSFLGGPLLIRAACYTAGVVGGLSAVAVCAPNEKFLNMGGVLAMGLGIVFASSIGTFFLPPTTMLGASMYSVVTYGGLVLFSGFLLYDTQRVVKMAEHYPTYALKPFDPINAQIGIYLDTINIFMRIAMILASGGGGGGNRRR
ncbi:Growth hormone-inducible transmembrane protein [Trichinella nelsoni]|uniref:Growth hormone-inducible transmembrane protein n=1 Tax=Trichinella nelsoni TaxID=6336 RepID=A0A0V0SDC1_9BILA|nr:Growth hormone-inducible transmembrane protein [Trichinella nelsoni]